MTAIMSEEPDDRAAKAERLREKKLRAARRLLDEYGDARGSRQLQAEARCIDFDLKQGGIYFNSCLYYFPDLDHDEESPIGPMRFTDTIYGGDTVEVDSVGLNILSVKIACSDIGFPIQVYGTVVARDSIDYKRVYLFRRDSDHPQLISSKKEGLILTGPKRALVLSDDDYIETDLWVKDDQGHCREFSKGLLTIPGSAWQNLHGSRRRVVGTESLATRLSTVDVRYEAVQYAVEATIAVEVLQGEFRGLIVAHTSGSKKRMLTLYDSSKVADGGGVIQLMRPALSVCVEEDELIILAKTAGGEHYKGLKFPSRVYRGDVGVLFALGDVVIRVNVNWSIMDP